MARGATDRLVGRGIDMDRLTADFAEARVGAQCVLVLADAGTGKTRLVEEFAAGYEADALVLRARAYPMGTTDSLGLWIEALNAPLRGADPGEIERLCGPHADDLAALFVSVAAARPDRTSGEPTRLRLLQGLAFLLERLSEDRPLLVFLDDVHQADGSSWQALDYLVRSLRVRPVLFLLAARPGELGSTPDAARAIGALEQDGLLRRHELLPLGSADLRVLAAQTVGAEAVPTALVDWLQERSLGNPLFAIGLVRALLDERADLSKPSLDALPEDLGDRVVERVARLDEPAQTLLELLAVIGARTEALELQRFSGRSLEELGEILEDLVRLRLVTEDTADRALAYELSHPLVAAAIYDSIGAARRRALHRLVARGLTAMGRRGAAASHFVHSAGRGDDEAISALCGAVREAEARELHRELLALLEALVELVPAGDRRWLDVFDAMAHQPDWIVDHRVDADAQIAIRALRIIVQLLEGSGDQRRLAAAKFHLGTFLAWGDGEIELGRRLTAEALQLYEEIGDAHAALLARNELGYLAMMGGELAAHESIVADVIARARATGDRIALLQGLILRWIAEVLGHHETGLATIDEALPIAREEGKLYRVSYLHAQRALGLAWAGRMSEARESIAEGIAANSEYRDTLLPDYTLNIEWLSGDLDRALDQLPTIEGIGFGRRRVLGGATAAVCAAERGDLVLAHRILDRCSAAFGGRNWWVTSGLVPWARGVLLSFEGDHEQAADTLRHAIDDRFRFGYMLPVTSPFVDLAEVGVEVRDPQLDRQLEGYLPVMAESYTRLPPHWILAYVRAALLLARGRDADAATEFAAIVSGFRASGWHLLEGRALFLHASALVSSDREAATAAFQHAIELFDACGASVRRERAVAQLQRLGHHGRRVADRLVGPGSLTLREREVAKLAAEGLTAKEIAQRLVVGRRTVETHLERVYGKLSIRSKVELARMADQL